MTDPIYRTPAPLDFEGCGWEYDHDLRLIGEGDGERTYECRRCGAEIFEEN
jgi:hypothetical protein